MSLICSIYFLNLMRPRNNQQDVLLLAYSTVTILWSVGSFSGWALGVRHNFHIEYVVSFRFQL
jgi:hypothetical protein